MTRAINIAAECVDDFSYSTYFSCNNQNVLIMTTNPQGNNSLQRDGRLIQQGIPVGLIGLLLMSSEV